jgi:hypothetical protein
LYYIGPDPIRPGWCRPADSGTLPGRGVNAEGGEDAGLQGRAAGDDVDGAGAGGEGDGADAPELAQRPLGDEELSGLVGVANIGFPQRLGHERLDHRGVHAHRHVGSDPSLGPVPHRAQVQEVLEHPEAPLDLEQRAVGPHHLGRRRLVGAQAGGEHAAAGEQVLVDEGDLVVVVDEATLGDVDVEQPGHR